MRGMMGRNLSAHPIGMSRTHLISHSTVFSTSSLSGDGGGGGRGRGRGKDSPSAGPSALGTADEPDGPSPSPSGIGRGRGKLLPSSSIIPSFSSHDRPAKPMFPRGEPVADITGNREVVLDNVPEGLLPRTPGGLGRGKTVVDMKPSVASQNIQHENRHVRASPARGRDTETTAGRPSSSKMSQEEAVAKAMGVLSRAGGDRGRRGFDGRERGFPGKGGRAGPWSPSRGDESWKDPKTGLYRGNKADTERLARRIGPKLMHEVTEAIEKAFDRTLPSEITQKCINELDYQLRIECEREWNGFDDFGNPDINDTPTMPIREYLQKLRPFIMAYDDLTYEEWEQGLEDITKRLGPSIEKTLKPYTGRQRVVSTKQKKMLEDVAKNLPKEVPDSIKKFADRSIIALHSNPWWKLGRKRSFMESLVKKVTHMYQ